MPILKRRNLYLPALVIVAVVLLLLIFIGFSTYWNIDRARTHAMQFVHQQGSAIAEILETAIVSMPEMPDKERVIMQLLDNATENEAVAYAYITGNRDFAFHLSQFDEEDAPPKQQPEFKTERPYVNRIRKFDDARPVTYEVIRKVPLSNGSGSMSDNGHLVLVVGMTMQAFEDARREDLHHAFVMVTILAALGMSAAFFMYVINRYHRTNERLKKNQEKIRQSEKLAALGRMSAAVAHEIRNPLSSIRGFAQFLGHVLKDREKEHEYALIMVREVDRINRVVTDLLNFARPLEIEAVPTDPYELLSHTVRLVEADAAERGIDIRLHGEDCRTPVMLDANLMTQVLLNLLLNAIQSVENRGRVDAKVQMSDEGGRILFEIDDDGPGIGKADRMAIFDPFFTTREKGTGLGLSIVRKIVDNHQGEIIVHSPVPGKNRGCRFTVRLPVA